MTDTGLSVLPVVLAAIGLSLVPVPILFALAILAGRFWTWQLRNASLAYAQLKEICEHKAEKIARWRRRDCLFSVALILTVVLVIVSGRWALLFTLSFLLWPISFIYGGMYTLDLQYTWSRSPFHPVTLLTGEQAVRRGKVYMVIGVLSLLPCGLLALLSAVWPV